MNSWAWCCVAAPLATLAMTSANMLRFRSLRPESASAQDVAVCVAMRDESANAAGFVRSALAQEGVRALVVCDDRSSDGTPQVVREAIAGDRRAVVLSNREGNGKSAALWAAAQAANAFSPRYILFTDADVRLKEGAIAALVRAAERNGARAVTAWPKITPRGLGDVLVTPAVVQFLLAFLPLWRSAFDARCTAGNGQMFLVERATYERVGGHARLANAIVEDVQLAKLLAQEGDAPLVVCAARIASVVGYGSISRAASALGRSLFAGAGVVGCLGFALWQAMLFALPVLAAPLNRTASLSALVCAFAARQMVAIRMDEPFFNVAFLPLASIVCGFSSMLTAFRGARRQIFWRRRTIHA